MALVARAQQEEPPAAGKTVYIQYTDEEDLWHAAVLLAPAGTAAVTKQEKAAPKPGSLWWWILTPDGDIYPEELEKTAEMDYYIMAEGERLNRGRTMTGKQLRRRYEFGPHAPAGEPSLPTFARALAAVRRADPEAAAPAPQRRITGKSSPSTLVKAGAGGEGQGAGGGADDIDGEDVSAKLLPAAGPGKKWSIIASQPPGKKADEIVMVDRLLGVCEPFAVVVFEDGPVVFE